MISAALPFVAMLVAGAPWIVFATRRIGHRLGVILPSALVIVAVMLVLVVTHLTGLHLLTSVYVALAVILAAGIAVLVRTGTRLWRPSRAAIAAWLPASLGAIVWFGVVGLAQVLPIASKLSWVLNGDTSNNIHEARGYLLANGIFLSGYNPVPVVRSLLLLAMSGGRDAGSPTSELLHHDLIAVVTVWTLGLAVMSVLVGVVVSSLVPRQRTVATALTSAGGSLLTLTWFVSGLPIEFGYLNTAVSIPLLLACWIVFLEYRRSATVVLVALATLGLLMIATWTALAVVPVAIAILVGTKRWLEIRVLGRGPALAIGGSLVLVIALLALVTGPSLAEKLSVLGTSGHGFPVTHWLLAGLLAACIAAAAVLSPRLEPLLLRGVVALSIAAAVGVGVFVLLSQALPDPFSGYYASKFSWIMCVLMIAVALSIAAGAIALLEHPPFLAPASITALAAIALIALSVGPLPDRSEPTVIQPIDRVLGDRVWTNGEASATLILENLHDPGTTLLWDSGNPDEAFVNFWVLEYRGGGGGPESVPEIRAFAFKGYRELRDTGSYAVPSASAVCDVAELVPQPLTIVTVDPQLADDFSAECPDVGAAFDLVAPED